MQQTHGIVTNPVYAAITAVNCRKAFRLGKFLQDINNLRKSKATGYPALLELLAYGGEGVYYFIEQLVW